MSDKQTPSGTTLSFFNRKKRGLPSTSSSEEGTVSQGRTSQKLIGEEDDLRTDLLNEFEEAMPDTESETAVVILGRKWKHFSTISRSRFKQS
jgi:hypothetical protein